MRSRPSCRLADISDISRLHEKPPNCEGSWEVRIGAARGGKARHVGHAQDVEIAERRDDALTKSASRRNLVVSLSCHRLVRRCYYFWRLRTICNVRARKRQRFDRRVSVDVSQVISYNHLRTIQVQSHGVVSGLRRVPFCVIKARDPPRCFNTKSGFGAGI